MGCPASLEALQNCDIELKNIDSLVAQILQVVSKSKTPIVQLQGADRYKEDIIRFSVADVGETMVSTQISDMQEATNYVIKDLEVYFSGTPTADAYVDISTALTAGAGARIAGRYYQSGSFIHLDGDTNGHFGNALTSKPNIQLSAGTGSVAQTVYCTLHYYYK